MAAKSGTPAKSGGRPARNARESVGRERVMQVALQLFVANGYAGTSVKAVADELGISPPALYWYFPSKEELYVSVIEQAMRDFVEYVGQSLTDDDPVFRLSQLVRAHVTWQLQQADVALAFDMTVGLRSLSSEIPKERLDPIFKMELQYVEEVRSILRSGVEAELFRVDDVKTTRSPSSPCVNMSRPGTSTAVSYRSLQSRIDTRASSVGWWVRPDSTAPRHPRSP